MTAGPQLTWQPTSAEVTGDAREEPESGWRSPLRLLVGWNHRRVSGISVTRARQVRRVGGRDQGTRITVCRHHPQELRPSVVHPLT